MNQRGALRRQEAGGRRQKTRVGFAAFINTLEANGA